MIPYKQLPRDGTGTEMQEFPTPFKAIITRARDAATASSVITLNPNTSTIEVTSTGGAAFIRWVPITETAAISPFASVISDSSLAVNFDNSVAPNTVRRFAVPIESFVAQSSIVGLNRQYGLYQRVAIIGVASVASTEY